MSDRPHFTKPRRVSYAGRAKGGCTYVLAERDDADGWLVYGEYADRGALWRMRKFLMDRNECSQRARVYRSVDGLPDPVEVAREDAEREKWRRGHD